MIQCKEFYLVKTTPYTKGVNEEEINVFFRKNPNFKIVYAITNQENRLLVFYKVGKSKQTSAKLAKVETFIERYFDYNNYKATLFDDLELVSDSRDYAIEHHESTDFCDGQLDAYRRALCYLENRVKKIPIEELNLSRRANNALKRKGVDTINQLVEWSYEELLKKTNQLGPKHLAEIKTKLADRGLHLRDDGGNGND